MASGGAGPGGSWMIIWWDGYWEGVLPSRGINRILSKSPRLISIFGLVGPSDHQREWCRQTRAQSANVVRRSRHDSARNQSIRCHITSVLEYSAKSLQKVLERMPPISLSPRLFVLQPCYRPKQQLPGKPVNGTRRRDVARNHQEITRKAP